VNVAIIFVTAVFVVIIVIIALIPMLARRSQGLTGRQEKMNRAAPRMQAPAKVVDKREQVSGTSSSYGGMTSTSYFATFEFPDGSRLELPVTGPNSGQLVVGDSGRLTWQGTWFQGFEREILR